MPQAALLPTHRLSRSWSPRLGVALLLALGSGLPAPAFSQTGAQGVGTVAGTVYDSTRTRFLAGAEVVLEGAGISTITGPEGRFELSEVPAGAYSILFRHPRLQQLNLDSPSLPILVSAGRAMRVGLAIPSVASLRQEACESPIDPSVPGYVSGVVRGGGGRRIVPGAVVEAYWQVDGSLGTRRVVADAAGRYTLCDLPVGVEIGLRSGLGREVSSPAAVTLGEETVSLHDLMIFPRGSSRIVGRVVDYESGDPVDGVEVRLARTSHSAITGRSGGFVLNNIPLGQYRMEVEHLAYGVVADSLLVGEQTVDVRIEVAPQAIQIEGFTVVARPSNLENSGFYDREANGIGRFISRHDILRRDPVRLTEMFQGLPGVRLVPSRTSTEYDVLLRNRCEPTYIVDGQHYPREIFRVDDIHPSLVHGVEVYSSAAQIPAEYKQPQFERFGGGSSPQVPCGVILIWTGARF